jgi:membrane-associated phospholipid phosphatase
VNANRGVVLRSRRREIAIAVLLAAGVAVLAILTTTAPVAGWDRRIVVAAHPVVVADATLRMSAVAVTTVGSPLVVNALTLLAAIAVWRRYDDRTARLRASAYVVVSRAVELGAETGLKQLLQRSRPTFPDPVATATDASFPSGHAAGIAVLAVALLLVTCSLRGRRAPAGWIVGAVGVVLAVAASRVLLGMHYPTDVLGGALLGACVAFGLTPMLPAPER